MSRDIRRNSESEIDRAERSGVGRRRKRLLPLKFPLSLVENISATSAMR